MPRPDKYPRWASTNATDPVSLSKNVIEPPEDKKDIGWSRGERPPRNWENWLDRLTYLWIQYLDEQQTARLPSSGTFVPTIRGSLTPGIGGYNAQSGAYQVIGDFVTVNIYIGQTSHTGTGDLLIALPFSTASDVVVQMGSGAIVDTLNTTYLLLGEASANNSAVVVSRDTQINNEPIFNGTRYYYYSMTYKYHP